MYGLHCFAVSRHVRVSGAGARESIDSRSEAVDAGDGDEITFDHVHDAIAVDAQTVILAGVESFGG
jgi:hypothetical protein